MSKDVYTNVCPRVRTMIDAFEADGHDIISTRLVQPDIHFGPELHVGMSGRLTDKELAHVKDDCSGQLKHSFTRQWIGCWCCTIYFNRRPRKGRE